MVTPTAHITAVAAVNSARLQTTVGCDHGIHSVNAMFPVGASLPAERMAGASTMFAVVEHAHIVHGPQKKLTCRMRTLMSR